MDTTNCSYIARGFLISFFFRSRYLQWVVSVEALGPLRVFWWSLYPSRGFYQSWREEPSLGRWFFLSLAGCYLRYAVLVNPLRTPFWALV